MQRLSSLIISIYIAALLYASIPFLETISVFKEQLFWNNLAIFLILLVPVYYLINKNICVPVSRGAMRPLRAALLILALVGLVLTIFYHIIPLEPVYDLPSYIDKYFAPDTAYTIWLIAPLVILFI